MLLQLLAGAAVLGGLYEYTKDDPKVQLVRGVTAAGSPVATAVPVVNAAVHALQANPSLFVPTPKPPGYAPPQVPATGPLNLSPIVITPTGAGNVVVTTNADVQNALNTLGIANPPLVVDGNIGPLSKAALRTFQLTSGLPADGVVGPQTKGALSQALSALASPNAAIGRSAQVLAATLQSAAATVPIVSNQDIQHALNLLGATPPLVEDGNLGPVAIAAIKAFQMSHGLLVDGIAGPMVKTALQMALSNSGTGPIPTASDAYATASIPGLFHGESYDLDARARNAWRAREDNNYHPDRKTYWCPAEAVPGFINESELGVKFSEAKQKMMRDDGSSVPFGTEFGYNYLPPPPPPVAARPVTPGTPAAPGAPSAPLPIPGTMVTKSSSNAAIAAPTGYGGTVFRSGAVSPPPPPGMVSPPPPPGMVSPPPPPLPGFFPGRYPNQAFPGQVAPYPTHRHHHYRNDYYAQQQNLGQNGPPAPPPPSPYAPTLQDYQQQWREGSYRDDISRQAAAIASAPDPSQASAVVSASPDVPDNQATDPMLDQAIADADNADAQSGAIDPSSGASQSILDAGADFGYSSGRTGDFRHMTGTFGFGAAGGSHGKGGKGGKHRHHRHSQQQSPQSQEGGGGGGGGSDGGDDDDYGAEFGVVYPPAPASTSNAAFLAAAARNAAAGGNVGTAMPSSGMYYPPAPGVATNPQGQPYPYQGVQTPGRHHHHHHHHPMASQAQAQPSAGYGNGGGGNGGDYSQDDGDYDISGDFGGPAKANRHHESDNLARSRTTVRS